jgi:hypothetical protein
MIRVETDRGIHPARVLYPATAGTKLFLYFVGRYEFKKFCVVYAHWVQPKVLIIANHTFMANSC